MCKQRIAVTAIKKPDADVEGRGRLAGFGSLGQSDLSSTLRKWIISMVLLQSKQHSSIVGQNLGWHLLPIKTREKNPGLLLGKAWQHQASNHIGQILFWEQEYPKCNWGLLLGPASGVIDVEDDSPEGRELLDAAMTECGVQTPCYTSGKGVHRLFLHDERMVQDSAAIVKAFGTEWRFGDDAHQSIVPPSIHPSGKAYQWLPGLSPEEVTVARLPDTMWQLMLTLRAKWAEKLDQERQAKRQQTKVARKPTSYQTPTGNFTQHVDAAFENLGARIASFHGLVIVQRRMPVIFDAQDKVTLLRVRAEQREETN